MRVKASLIADFLGKNLVGQNLEIEYPADMMEAKTGALTFATKLNEEFIIKANKNRDFLVIANQELDTKLLCPHILVDNARLDFIRIVIEYFYKAPQTKIHPTCIIEPGAKIGENVTIGVHSYIGSEVVIGDGTIIMNNVSISGSVIIGEDCWIKSGAVIGEEGFGFEPGLDLKPKHFPHIGRIELGDRVFIGANSTIERASLSVTRLCDDVKVDDLVQIGHNTFIGNNTMIASGAVICGGTIVGENSWVAPNSSIKQKLKIGDNSVIGLGSVVIRDVCEEDIVAGNPAKSIKK